MKLAVLAMLLMLAVPGCKKTPTDSGEPPAPEAHGTFLGWGRPGGTGFNTKLDISGSDTTGWTGTIVYGHSSTPLAITEVTDDEDTVRFEYIRGTTYRLLGLITGVAITVFVLEPSGQPAYVLNKVQSGHNMSGDWSGRMYSDFLNTTEDSDLFMTHQGALYSGDVQTSYGFYTLMGNITQGGQDGDAFYLAGTAPFGDEDYPFQFDGGYVTDDSIAGTWQLTIPGGGDTGTFAFGRRF